jgi:hypothetical protein
VGFRCIPGSIQKIMTKPTTKHPPQPSEAMPAFLNAWWEVLVVKKETSKTHVYLWGIEKH